MADLVHHSGGQYLLLVDEPGSSEIQRSLVEDNGVRRGLAVQIEGYAKRITVYGDGLCHGCGKECQDQVRGGKRAFTGWRSRFGSGEAAIKPFGLYSRLAENLRRNWLRGNQNGGRNP